MFDILMVDDDAVDRMSVQRALAKSELPHRLTMAVDGIEGMKRLRHESATKPSLILLDLNMPRMHGLEFLAELRSDPVNSDSIVFVLTTSDADRDRAAAYSHHVAGYIVKSSIGDQSEKLVELIETYLQVVDLP